MLLRSRCFPLLVNRTFNRIAHKTAVAGCSCRAFPLLLLTCVLTSRPQLHPSPGFFQGGIVAQAYVRRGGLGSGLRLQSGLCKRDLAGGEKAKRQGPSLPEKLSTQSRLGFNERVSHKVGATFPWGTCVCWGVQERETSELTWMPPPLL